MKTRPHFGPLFTNYNPTVGTYGVNYVRPTGTTWILDTYTDRTVTATTPGDTAASNSKELYCFDAKGSMTRRRTLMFGTASLANPNTKDLMAVYTYDTAGNMTGEQYYGADANPMPDASTNACTAGLPATSSYRMVHTYQYGQRATTRYSDSAGSSTGTLAFYTLDRTFDSSGLLASSRERSGPSSTGIATSYAYDLIGRLQTITPTGAAPTTYVYTNPTATTNARVTRKRISAGVTLEESEREFDGFGRPVKDVRVLPGGARSASVTTYDSSGRVETQSMWQPEGTSTKVTSYTGYDAFGRPGTITAPDLTSVSMSYLGDSKTSRTVRIGTVRGAVSPFTDSVTDEYYDRQGQLWKVNEPSGAGGALTTTTYTYDMAGRLLKVVTGTQSRTFTYDQRGFLTSAQQPEVGTTGNGYTNYSEFDARGHAGRVKNGTTSATVFDLHFVYDRAERLTDIYDSYGGTPNVGRAIKNFSFGTSNTAGDWALGALKTATRYNPVERFALTATVQETYTYGDTAGRVTQRDTTLDDGVLKSFSQSFTYDALGNTATTTYPRCTMTPCTGTDVARVVTNKYTNGFLTGVDWSENGGAAVGLGTISYHSNGMVNAVGHTLNGTTDTHGIDPNAMPRFASITTTGAASSWTSGAYGFDGAGNVIKAGSDYYVYDKVNRLVDGSTSGGTKSQQYAYDIWGNLTSITTAGVTPARTFTVNGTTNRLTNGTYDAAGNAKTWNGLYTYDWDAMNMMKSLVASGEDRLYMYTADDERLRVFDYANNISTYRVRDLGGRVLREITEDGSGGTTVWRWKDWVYRGSSLLLSKNKAGSVQQFHLDHLGTPRMITTTGGTVVERNDYYPFGEDVSTPSATEDPFKFTGHERDTFSFNEYLDDMHARYYTPFAGRFLSVDPAAASASAARPQTWNRYAYVMNSPVTIIDPDGRCPWCVGGLTGGIIGVAVAGYQEGKRSLHEPVTWAGSARRVGAAFVGGAISGASGTVGKALITRFGLSLVGGAVGGVVNRAGSGQRQSLDGVQRDVAATAVGFAGGEAAAKALSVATRALSDKVMLGAAVARAEASASNAGLVRVNDARRQATNNINNMVVSGATAAGESISNATAATFPAASATSTRADAEHTHEQQR